MPSLFSPCLVSISQLKSLDKKIAKAENGSGTGTEDVAQLKLVSVQNRPFHTQPPFFEGVVPPAALLLCPCLRGAIVCADARALSLAQRAEELKKEKMAVAFTYGLKEKAGGGGLEFDAAAVAAANGESPAKSASKPKKPKAAVKKDDHASTGSSASLTSGIPTPPDEVSLDGKTCPPTDFDIFFWAFLVP